jgi:hypothetical protein
VETLNPKLGDKSSGEMMLTSEDDNREDACQLLSFCRFSEDDVSMCHFQFRIAVMSVATSVERLSVAACREVVDCSSDWGDAPGSSLDVCGCGREMRRVAIGRNGTTTGFRSSSGQLNRESVQ